MSQQSITFNGFLVVFLLTGIFGYYYIIIDQLSFCIVDNTCTYTCQRCQPELWTERIQQLKPNDP